jgi:hypothetical protein
MEEQDWSKVVRHTAPPQLAGAGDAFLDTIPEDVSVAADRQRIASLSTASAVASSDSGEGGGKKERSGGSATSEVAVLGGTGETTVEQAPASDARRRTTTRRAWVFYGTVCCLLVGIAIAIYFIIAGVSGNDESDDTSYDSPDEDAPTPETTFPPFSINFDTDFPSSSPTFNLEDMADIDFALSEITSGSSPVEMLYDLDTPQGKCRFWLTHTDHLELRVDIVGEARIQQRHILCVLYYATDGPLWSTDFIDKDAHECEWAGISCNDEEVAVIILSQINLVGSLPTELVYLKELQALSLYGNSLTGTIPEALLFLPKLVHFDLSENYLTGFFPKAPAGAAADISASKLQVLYLYDNQIQGSIPLFPELERLCMNHNLLTELDDGYASLETLTSLIAYNNSFSGPLPQTWNAPNLVDLDLAWNLWTGPIPESLWDLPNLQTCVLHDCQLTGTLPTNMGLGDQFQNVWLYSNQLTGTFPSTLGWNWANLTSYLLYDNNDLSGSVGEELCGQWEVLEKFETDCDLATVDCFCCTACHGG